MSFKAKDLQFDNSQPAFLRRLRGELTTGDQARHEKPIPRNKRLKQDDEDDAPTYVMEETKESLTKEEYEALVAGKDARDKDKAPIEQAKADGAETESKQQKDKIAEAGTASKKRKAAKIIGNEEDESKAEENKEPKKIDPKSVKKSKKKSKPIKLTFGDDEEA